LVFKYYPARFCIQTHCTSCPALELLTLQKQEDYLGTNQLYH
jgi:hypothetical protein